MKSITVQITLVELESLRRLEATPARTVEELNEWAKARCVPHRPESGEDHSATTSFGKIVTGALA